MEEKDERAKQTKTKTNEDAKNVSNFINLSLNDSSMELDFSTEKPHHDMFTNFSKSQQSKQTDDQMISKNYGDITDRYWWSMRDFSNEGPIQDILNFYIYDDLVSLKKDFLDMFYKQNCRFRINFSFGFILRHRTNNKFRYWLASNGNDRILDFPHLVSNFSDYEVFLGKVFEQDMLEKARLSRPDSSWLVNIVTNITFFINKLKKHPFGCRINLPNFAVCNKRLYVLQKNYNNGKMYSDYLCLFRSLALHTGCTSKNLVKQAITLFFSFCKFSNINPNNFQEVTLHELSQVEKCF